jgi:ribonuclease P protein component
LGTLTLFSTRCYICCFEGVRGNATENIPTQQPKAREGSRISTADEDPRRPTGIESQTGQGTKASRGRALLVLRNAAEFKTVYQGGAKKISRSFVVFVHANGLEYNRFGLTTPRKLGPAHERNRIKRRVREILRNARAELPHGFDIVVNPRRSAYDRDFSELRAELVALLGGVS